MIRNKQSPNLDTKLWILRSLIAGFQGDVKNAGSWTDRLLFVLKAQMKSLLFQKLRLALSLEDIADMRRSLHQGRSLLAELKASDIKSMATWYHGISPLNPAQGLANLLSRIILELTATLLHSESSARMVCILCNEQDDKRTQKLASAT